MGPKTYEHLSETCIFFMVQTCLFVHYLSGYYHHRRRRISYLQLVLDYNDFMKIPVLNDSLREVNENSAKVR